jgi:hypothetical protein
MLKGNRKKEVVAAVQNKMPPSSLVSQKKLTLHSSLFACLSRDLCRTDYVGMERRLKVLLAALSSFCSNALKRSTDAERHVQKYSNDHNLILPFAASDKSIIVVVRIGENEKGLPSIFL